MTEQYIAKVTKMARASQRALFEAWLDVDALKEFMIPMEGTVVEDVFVDAKVGGKFSLVMSIGDTKIPIKGKYTNISRYNFLEFTWFSPHTKESSVVSLEFKKISDKETEITLTHRGLHSKESMRDHTSGWTSILGHLVERIG